MIRQATIDDAEGVAGIHVRAWQAAYSGIVPAAYLADLSEEKRTVWWRKQLSVNCDRILVAVNEGRVAGWASFGPSRDDDGKGRAEVYAVYVLPEHWARGIGRNLMSAIEAELADSTEITLWVLEQNQRALRFYASMGFRPDSAKKEITIGDMPLIEIRLSKMIRRPN